MVKTLLLSRSFHYVYILQNYLKIVNKLANFLVKNLKRRERMELEFIWLAHQLDKETFLKFMTCSTTQLK